MKKIKLYKDNKISNKYDLTLEELAQKFIESKYYQDYVKGHFYNMFQALIVFIGSADGLNSTCEHKDIAEDSNNYLQIKNIINKQQS